jgi:hypothetical protein
MAATIRFEAVGVGSLAIVTCGDADGCGAHEIKTSASASGT